MGQLNINSAPFPITQYHLECEFVRLRTESTCAAPKSFDILKLHIIWNNKFGLY